MDVTELALKDEYMQMAVCRIKSYEDWPLSFMDTQEMALAGLYYTGYKDVTCCPFCTLLFMYWTVNDHPFCKNRRVSPDCPFKAPWADPANPVPCKCL
jgi:hypothetical protein